VTVTKKPADNSDSPPVSFVSLWLSGVGSGLALIVAQYSALKIQHEHCLTLSQRYNSYFQDNKLAVQLPLHKIGPKIYRADRVRILIDVSELIGTVPKIFDQIYPENLNIPRNCPASFPIPTFMYL
jgi:hypothetical protein